MIINETINRRLTFVSVALLAISGMLMARLLSFQYYMDSDTREAFQVSREGRVYRTIEIQPNRGQIYDRSGYLLATNSFNYRVGISPNHAMDRQAIARQLAPLLNIPENELYHAIGPNSNGQYPRWKLLAPVVSFETGQAIADLDIDEIILEPIPIRVYPQGDLMAQIVGFYGGSEDSPIGRGYFGVEGFYQTLLAGQSRRVTTSTIPILDEERSATSVRDGMDLVLTIDRDLQFLAQEVLDDAVERYKATGGTILIMNPRNGEILAIANSPTFDPDDPSPENLERAGNQAVTSIYEPGSVFKVLTMAIAIESGIDYLTWNYANPEGCITRVGYPICNWDRAAHGTVYFPTVFIESLNTGTVALFEEIGLSRVYPLLQEFGIGSPTGVDIEGEARGILALPGDPNWNELNFLTTSYGQGVAITPLQLLTAVNAIANDGLIMQPHIVKARIDGGTVIETQPSATHRPISAETARIVRDIMVEIVRNPASQDDYSFTDLLVAGKTGTAEIPDLIRGGYEVGYDGHSIAAFVGFLPADDPVVSILVKLDRPVGYWGSKTAAPTFQQLVERMVMLMEIMPDSQRYQLIAQGGSPFAREY